MRQLGVDCLFEAEPVVGVSDDLKLIRQVTVYKARHRMSPADAFCAALAKEIKIM